MYRMESSERFEQRLYVRSCMNRYRNIYTLFTFTRMKKLILLLATLCFTTARAWADGTNPIDTYDEPRVSGDTAPAEEWNALTDGLHASWANRDEHYQLLRVPQLNERTEAEITAWKGERANIEAVLFSKTDQGTLKVRFVDGSQNVLNWCSARFINYVITDDFKSCGSNNMKLAQWLSPDVIDQDKAHAVPAMETRPIWCSVEVPRDAQAGKQTVTLQVLNESNEVVKSLTLTINVVDRSLPTVENQKFHLDLWQQPYSVSRYYGVERWSDAHIAALRPYLEALGRAGQKVVSTIMFYEPWGNQTHDKFSAMVKTTKKTDGTWSYDYTIFDKYVNLCAECGIKEQINCYSMVPWDKKFRYYDEATGTDIDLSAETSSDDYKNLWNSFLDAFKAHLQEKGWFEKTCIAMDERGESDMLNAYAIAKAKGFKMALAGNYHQSLSLRLDDYCVALNQVQKFTPEQLKFRKEHGMPTTLYVSCADAEPNMLTNSLPAEAAFLPLHAAANNLDGFLHWSWLNWNDNPLTDSRYRLYSSGDTYSYYPGNRSSVRFERLVEGIHQYEKIQILKETYKNDADKLKQLNTLLADCQDYVIVGEECAAKVNRLEDFLNGKEVTMPEGQISGYFQIKVDDTHYAKAAANLTKWGTELSAQSTGDLFEIKGTYDACTIKLKGRSNNMGPDKTSAIFVDQTASTKYTISKAEGGKVVLKNNGKKVFVSNGSFTLSATDSTLLELVKADEVVELDRTTLFSTLAGGMDIPPYRIPGITRGKNGRLLASCARLVGGTDPGFGQVDCVVKISDDNGKTWSQKEIDVAVGDASLINNKKTPMEAAYGDPAVVMDREHNEALVMAVGGCTVYTYGTTNRQNPNIIAAIRSLDGGETWQTPVDQTEEVYGLFDSGKPLAAAFVGGGKLFQSRVVKVGEYYRIYAALAARPNGNRVIYSDDFGRTWKALGGASATPASIGDEPKCEELPDGRVILTSRTGSGRLFNLYTYSNTRTGEGEWSTEVKATFSGLSASPSANPTNGEMLIVPVKRVADSKPMYVALQSVPTGSGRNNVGIFYKELADMSDIRDLSAFSAGWDGFFQVSSTASAYSSLDLQADGKIGFFYEETLTKWGTKANPVSTSFPTGAGTHNFDGFENIYVPIDMPTLTDGKYEVSNDVNRGEYLKAFFNELIAASTELSAAQQTEVKGLVNKLSAEPTIDQIDAIYAILGKSSVTPDPEPEPQPEGSPQLSNADVSHWYKFCSKRTTILYPTSQGADAALKGVADATQASEWKFVERTDGTFDIVNRADGLFVSPYSSNNAALKTVSAQPANGWKFLAASTAGYFVVVCDANHAELNQTQAANQNKEIYNWGYGSSTPNAYRLDDLGCQFTFTLTETEEHPSTGISAVTVDTDSDHWYDLSGRRVAKRTKGIYVSANGQKVAH